MTITNLTMRDITNAPIYLRLGGRNRAPEGTRVGTFRRVTISNVTIHNAPMEQSVIIAGIPDHPIEDVKLDNIRIYYEGGGTEKQASTRPSDRVTDYPEPQNHGPMPAYGFFVRHVKNLELSDIQVSTEKPDVRPPFVIEQAKGVGLSNVKATRGEGVPMVILRNVEGLSTHRVQGVADTMKEKVEEEKL